MYMLLKELVKTTGVSGRESGIRAVIEKAIAPYVDETYTDALGNLIAHKKGAPGAKKLMLAAHMDEIGFFVTDIDDKGRVHFAPAGGIRFDTTAYSEVIFENGVHGILVANDDAKPFEAGNCYVDIGFDTRKDAASRVRTGDTFAVAGSLRRIGGRVVGRPVDDRVGCAVLIEAASRVRSSQHDVYYTFTVQEEVGCRGSRTASYGIMPDIAVAVDITKTGDVPGAPRMAVKLGAGAAIKIKDTSVICDPALVDRMIDLCKDNEIKYQLEILTMGGTDTSEMQSAGAGCSAGCISVPTRYAHTPLEMIDMRDVEACAALTTALIEG